MKRTRRGRRSNEESDFHRDSDTVVDKRSGLEVDRRWWDQRFRLFSRFDEGILLDSESWFSVSPECIAAHTARRIAGSGVRLVVDACCGAGGNTVQLATECSIVISVDIDPKRAAMCAHNSAVYGVRDRVEIVVGDFVSVSRSLRADAVFLSPPWGGPSYKSKAIFDLSSIRPDGKQLFACADRVSHGNVAYYLPMNTDASQLASLSRDGCEVEHHVINGRQRCLTAYFGSLRSDRHQVQK